MERGEEGRGERGLKEVRMMTEVRRRDDDEEERAAKEGGIKGLKPNTKDKSK